MKGPGFEEDVQPLAQFPQEVFHPAQDAATLSREAGNTFV